ncbi:hypothetical protein [Chryseobacterium endophyticum]|uniref:Uncharacterized protein n=1 Tax=Chryseobacterium endophyticum TaxID=1854762 RepID=A0AAU6WU45_9FLAO
MQETISTISTFDLFNLIAAISSIILAIFALVLSIIFYKWSDKSNKEIVSVAQAIDNNTKKIENLFDRLYSDTFGIMKSNVEAMQRQLYDFKTSEGDSSLNNLEIIEENITSMLSKSQSINKELIYLFIQKIFPSKGISNNEVDTALQNLISKGTISINQNLIILISKDSLVEESK